mgnify:CR=1 FL=1
MFGFNEKLPGMEKQNARVWLFVSPSIGIPLFFIGVMVMALVVHFAILNNTTWFKAFWQGKAVAAVSMQAPTQVAVTEVDAIVRRALA